MSVYFSYRSIIIDNSPTRKTQPNRSRLIWTLGNLGAWDRFTKRTPPDISHAAVIVHAPNHLGDNIMSIPLVMSLLDRNVRVSIVSRSEYAFIWTRLSKRLHVISYQGWCRNEVRQLRKTLLEHDADVAFLLATGMEVARLYLRAGVKHRLGFDYWGRGFLLTARLRSYHEPSSPHLVDEHHSENMMRLLSLLPQTNSYISDNKASTCLNRPPLFEFDKGNTDDRNVDTKEIILGIALAGNTLDKSPSTEFWRSVISKLGKKRGPDRIKLLGIADQRQMGNQLRQGNEHIENLCGDTDVESLMNQLLDCDVVISPDSGIAHLAAACGIPVIVLFTSGAPSWTRPVGNSVTILSSNISCSPCFNRQGCQQKYSCVSTLDTDRVVTAILETGSFFHLDPWSIEERKRLA